METFLNEVAQRLRAEHPDDLDRVVVVFNNRRSGLFLRRQLSQMDDKSFFLPHIIGMDDWVAELGGLEIVPNEFLLFELFDIHRHLGGEGRKFETFEEFIPFGEMMLNDFAEIDLYQVDASQLFSNLHELKAIGEWNIEGGKLTEFQKQYLNFYRSLYRYYHDFRQRLLADNKAYGGMAYREVAEHIDTLSQQHLQQPIYFVGFNVLSSCEHAIIQHYCRGGMGTFVVDGDAYYFDNPRQEAGHFLRQHRGSFPGIGSFADHFAEGKKTITISSCPENIIQCKYAGSLLANQVRQHADTPIEQTAVVLADESLLLPLLNSLPEEIPTANITMGFPFTNTAANTLMLKLFSLHQRRRDCYFHHQDILDLLSDGNIAPLLHLDNCYGRLCVELARQNIIYAELDTIEALCQSLGGDFSPCRYLFDPQASSPDGFLATIQQLILQIDQAAIHEHNVKEHEALACLYEIAEHFRSLQQKYHFVENLNVLLRIYTRMAQRRSVPFYGEPLSGLQILGVLETRNLDFRRVILLSTNEGMLPAGRTPNTLIPHNLKRAFGIPTYREKDAVYAYNFYRLLQRADEVHLIYSTDSEGIGKGEASRFLLQVRDELAPQYPNNITLRQEVISVSNASVPNDFPDRHAKDAFAMQRLEQMAQSQQGLSPSALAMYCQCPLHFYYHYILSLKPKEEVSEELEQNDLGNCVHEVLRQIYSIDTPNVVRVETLQQSLTDIDNLIDNALRKLFLHGRSHEGRNHLMENLARIQLTNFLNSEIRRIGQGHSTEIIGLECDLAHEIPIDVDGRKLNVRIAGRADRIDRVDGCVRITDYKTGKVEEKELVVNEEEPQLENVSKKWLQVMAYAWMYQRGTHPTKPMQSGIFPMGRTDIDLLKASWCGSEILSAECIDSFERALAKLLAELFHPDIPFLAVRSKEDCKFCPFDKTCGGKNQ